MLRRNARMNYIWIYANLCILVTTRHAAKGSVERCADDLMGTAGSTALRWHSADIRRDREPRCRSADCERFAVRHGSARGQHLLRRGCFWWLIKCRQPACHKLAYNCNTLACVCNISRWLGYEQNVSKNYLKYHRNKTPLVEHIPPPG